MFGLDPTATAGLFSIVCTIIGVFVGYALVMRRSGVQLPSSAPET